MSRFAQVSHPQDPQLKSLYEEIVASGMHGADPSVPMNGFTAFSDRPDVLGAMWSLTKGVILEGNIPPTVKQMVAMSIAMQNDCRYCSVAHTRALEMMGVPTEVVQSCAADPEMAQVPPVQRAIVQFALKTVRDPAAITEADVDALREHGLADGDIIEVIMIAAWSSMLNTWTDVSAVVVDGEE